MKTRREFLKTTLCGTAFLWGTQLVASTPEKKPNILFIFIDDMGYGDLSCYGNTKIKTPNIDRVAEEGIRFTQFYANAPISSPSRVAVTTGQYPAKWNIDSYLDSRDYNQQRNMANYLDPNAPSLARVLKKAGYATAHFGKWHMGGGRDIGEAPLPQQYGFDESLVSFEGLGERILPPGSLSDRNAKLGCGKIQRVEKHEMSEIYVDRAIRYIRNTENRPFYINLWPNDVHDGHHPKPGLIEKYKKVTENRYEQKFFAVLEELDRQIGRVLDEIDQRGLARDTIILFTSDNGPTDWPKYYERGYPPPGSSGPFKGRKWSLHEGGIRMPFMAQWKGHIPAGKVNDTSVMCLLDIFPTLCAMAKVPIPEGLSLDGVAMSQALLGNPTGRNKAIYWYYINDLLPGDKDFVTPKLAMRKGAWKLLMEPDGSDIHLYNLAADPQEEKNLTGQYPERVEAMKKELRQWTREVHI